MDGKISTPEYSEIKLMPVMEQLVLNRGLVGVTTQSDEARLKMSKSSRGKPKTDEHRENLSKAKKGKGPLSEEHKQKISDAKKGRTVSEETRQRMSEARKKVWNERKNQNS